MAATSDAQVGDKQQTWYAKLHTMCFENSKPRMVPMMWNHEEHAPAPNGLCEVFGKDTQMNKKPQARLMVAPVATKSKK